MLNTARYTINALGDVISTQPQPLPVPATQSGVIAGSPYTPEELAKMEAEWASDNVIRADKTMSMVIRFPGMVLAGVGQWLLNRTRDPKNYVDPFEYAGAEKNKNLTWMLALAAWGGIGYGIYRMFFKKGGN